MSVAAVADSAKKRPKDGALTGAGTLTRFLLRRDRVKLPAWVGGLGVYVVYIGFALPQLAPNKDDLASMSSLFSQPVGRMFTGPAFGISDPTYERFFASGYAPYLFVLAGLMNIMLVSRHTRAEEQTGRAELVRANVTGRHAALTACLLVAAITNALAAIVVMSMSVWVGFAVTGSVLIGLGTGLTGMAFAGVTAVTVQLSEYSRTAAGMAGAVLGASFVLRALGDMTAVGGSTLSWVSPLGWPAQSAPYVYDRWAPLLLPPALTLVTIIAAYVLHGRRDLGASLIATRPGPPHARPALGTPYGLAIRIQRGTFFGWGFGILVLGIVYGAFMQALIDAGGDMPAALQDILGSDALVEAYSAFLGLTVSILIAAYTVSAMQTLRAEEGRGRGDVVLATPTGRMTWLGSHTAVVAAGAVLISILTGISTGIAAAVVTEDWSLLGDVLAAYLCLIPGILIMLGIWTALIGWAPRLLTSLGWALVALSAIVVFFGDMLDLPAWMMSLSPFDHLAQIPQDQFELSPFVFLTVLGVLAAILGLIGIRRRQINVV